MSEIISEAWVGINEAAAHLGATPETIRNWIKKTDIPAHKIREMETTGDQFLTLASQNIRYYEMLLGHDYDPNTLKSVLM